MKLRLFALILALLLLLSACNIPGMPIAPTGPTLGVTEPTDGTHQPPNSTDAPPNPTDGPTGPAETPHACPEEDPYQNVNKTTFYADYSPACCLTNARYRSQHYLLSGTLEVPGQYAEDAAYRPQQGDKFVRNTAAHYEDNGNTYIVYDGNGKEVLRLYKGGAYITLEEVAAYMYAFGGEDGSMPANYDADKDAKPRYSQWGEYLRVNHSYFSGSTSKYPYEPELPDIKGCGGDLKYYEMDIGTTGTVTEPKYPPALYNNGSSITRGAARIVYTRFDGDGDGKIEIDEIYVFYTHNHYNDFREYLNYYGGWGEMFGNVTGGGTLSSKYDYNPTPYVPTAYADLTAA